MPYLMIMQEGRSTVAEEAPVTTEADLYDLFGEECVLCVVGFLGHGQTG